MHLVRKGRVGGSGLAGAAMGLAGVAMGLAAVLVADWIGGVEVAMGLATVTTVAADLRAL